MNRTSHILKSFRDRLGLLQTNTGVNYNVLSVWDIKQFHTYQTPYVYCRALGETSQTVNNYEDTSRSCEFVDLAVEIILGYTVYTDVDGQGNLTDEQLERTHEVRQWLDNADFRFNEYRDPQETVQITGCDYSGFNGVTQNDTVGCAVIGNVVSFQAIKRYS